MEQAPWPAADVHSTSARGDFPSEYGNMIQFGVVDSNTYMELERSYTNTVPNHAADCRIADADFYLIFYR